MWMFTLIGLCALLTIVDGSIIVYTQSTPHAIMEEFRDMPADFGPDVPPEGLRGFLVAGTPADGCTNLTAPPTVEDNFTMRWIVLIAKNTSGCSYETQVRNAQEAGYNLAIVHNVNSSDLEVMTALDPDGIIIPSVFVTDLAGLILSEEYLYDKGFYIMVNSELPFNINTHLLLPFAIVVVLCLVVILVFMIVKCIKDRRRARRHRLPNRALAKIPTCKFSKGDPYETCAICLDDYQEGERLRVLPCAHAYHTVCIDPWLTQNRRVCPVCKRRVFAAGERRRIDSSSSSSDDTAPLLPNRPVTHGGTFDEQRENPFARATRFMARLRARHENGDNSEVSSSPPDDNNEQINTNNDENGNSEAAAFLDRVEAVLQARRERIASEIRQHLALERDTAVPSNSEVPVVVTEVRESRRSRRNRARARPSAEEVGVRGVRPQHSINTTGRGEIGVAALPAPQPNPGNLSL